MPPSTRRRDTQPILASTASLTAVLHGTFTDQIDPVGTIREVKRRWTLGLERAMPFRPSGRVAEREHAPGAVPRGEHSRRRAAAIGAARKWDSR
jgi:hypothetical protein